MAIKPSDQPLAEMILFISERSEGDDRFGAIKLNKLLFYSDFLAYLRFGKSITGQEYQQLQNGPAPRRLLTVRRQLLAEKSLAIRKVEYVSQHQERTFALREPDLSAFTAQQIGLVTKIIDVNRGSNGTEASELSHRFVGCEDVAIGETIPYEFAFLSRRPPTSEELKRIQLDVPKAREFLAGLVPTHDA